VYLTLRRQAAGGVRAAGLAAEEAAQVGFGLEGGEGQDLVGRLEGAGVGGGDHLPGRCQPGREPGSDPATANDHDAHAGQASAGAVSGSGTTNR
jgi:hypothetical protein